MCEATKCFVFSSYIPIFLPYTLCFEKEVNQTEEKFNFIKIDIKHIYVWFTVHSQVYIIHRYSNIGKNVQLAI